MPDTAEQSVLLFSDTVRSPEMRREIAHVVNDPFFYVEHGGKRRVLVRALEIQRMREVPDLEAHVLEEYGVDDLADSGLRGSDLAFALVVAFCRRLGVQSARVPSDFPVALADALRGAGISIQPDPSYFERRQRSKTDGQIAGIRRAQSAAEAATAAVAALLRASFVVKGALHYEDEPLTSERLKRAARVALAEHGAVIDEFIVAHGAQTCIGHHLGSGVVGLGEPVTVDLGPRDPSTGCGTDMTRTFVVGDVSDELRAYHDLDKRALDAVEPRIAAGVTGAELYASAAAVFEESGYPTLRTRKKGEVLLDGFFHTLGHGVGLRLHEAPHLSPEDERELIEGDVVAIEPGCYRQGYGGVRLENVYVVTANGSERITDYSYSLAP